VPSSDDIAQNPLSNRWLWLAVAVLVVGWLGPFPELSGLQQRALGIALFALILWSAQPIPIEISSLAVLLLLPASGLLDFAATFAPFAQPTIWLVFSGMVLSLLLSATGLGDRLAQRVRPLIAGGGRWRVLIGLHVLSLATAFLVPSGVVRVLLLMPIGISLTQAIAPSGGIEARRWGAAVALSLVCGTYFGGCGVLTGSVPNLVVIGQLEAATGRVVFWGEWLRWMFPVIGALRTILCLGVVWLVAGRDLADPVISVRQDPVPLNSDQRRALFLLVAGVCLWATDPLHELPPVYVGLFLVLMSILPGWGPLNLTRLREINFPLYFYIAALFGMGTALDLSGVNERVVSTVLQLLPDAGGHWLSACLALTAAALPLDFLMDIAAVGAVVTPSLLEVGQGYGLTPVASAMSVAMATSLVFLPYQAAPFMVALTYRQIALKQMVLTMFILSLLSLLLLCPLNVFYWRVTGLI
jgi:anion transporter